MSAVQNIHATALVVGRRGVLIMGASGAGKTTLALSLIDRARADGGFARLVSDDRVDLDAVNGRLIAAAPSTIAGLAEVYGLGPAPVANMPAAAMDLAVRLEDAAPRYQKPGEFAFAGVVLPQIDLPLRNAPGGVLAVRAALATIFGHTCGKMA